MSANLGRTFLIGGFCLFLLAACSSDDPSGNGGSNDTEQPDTTVDAADTAIEDTSDTNGPDDTRSPRETTETEETTNNDTDSPEDTSIEDTSTNDMTEPEDVRAIDAGETTADAGETSETVQREEIQISEIYSDSVEVGDDIYLESVVVTAVKGGTSSSSETALFVQEPKGTDPKNNAIFVRFDTAPGSIPARGDNIDLTGKIADQFGFIEISSPTVIEVNGGPQLPLPEPAVVTPGDVATGGPQAGAYLGSLVRVEDVVVKDANPDGPNSDFGDFTVDGDLRVGNYLYEISPNPIAGDPFDDIQGPLWRSVYGNNKIVPRDEDDVGRPNSNGN